MSVYSDSSTFNFSSYSSSSYSSSSSSSLSEEEHTELTSWKFSGCYYHNSPKLPCMLVVENNVKLHDFRNGIVGLTLPTYLPAGIGDEPLKVRIKPLKAEKLNYLHLFNSGNTGKMISGTVDGVPFTNIYIPSMKRVILEKCL